LPGVATGGDGLVDAATRQRLAQDASRTTVVNIATARERRPIRPFRDLLPNIGLDDRLGRLLLSIVLALLLWFYVTSLENPEQTTVFKNLVVEVRGAASDLKVMNTLPPIDVSVQAPQTIMNTLRASDVHPFVDLSGYAEGVHDIPVRAQVAGQPPGVQVSLSPNKLQVQIEVQVTRVVSVAVAINGTPAFGYGLEPAQVDPGQVQMIGTRDIISRVARVIVPIDVDEKAGTQRGFRTPLAVDDAGKEVAGVTFSPDRVQVVVPIKLLLNYKVVPVRVPVEGQPASGYRVSAITVDPTNATVCCSPNLLEPLQFLETNPVAITGTTSTVITTTQLILPAGVELYPGQSKVISVTVSVDTPETTFQLSVAPTLEGVQDGLTAIISPNRLDVTLAGTLAQVQSLKPTDVKALINVQGRGPGTYELQPQIVLPQGVKLEQLSPDNVTVTLLAPTPVPPTYTVVPAPTSTPNSLPGSPTPALTRTTPPESTPQPQPSPTP
jgi:YbbR domain-containing protein